nr:uncharacterized protein LOC121125787 [Lepeophtheirus salmonis]
MGPNVSYVLLLIFILMQSSSSYGSLRKKKCSNSTRDCNTFSEYCDHFESLCKPCSEFCSDNYKGCWKECPSYVGRVVRENLSNAEQIKNLQIILAVLSSISILTLATVLILLFLRIKDHRKVYTNDNHDSKDKDSMHQIMPLRKIPPSTLPSLQHGTSMQTVTTRISEYGPSIPKCNRMNGGRMPSEDTVNERVSSPDVHPISSIEGTPSPVNPGPFTISNSQII